MKKRLFTVVLALLLAVSPISVFATGDDNDTDIDIGNQYTTKFVVDTKTVGNDDSAVAINISVSENSGFAGMTYKLTFDSTALSLNDEPVVNEAFGFDYISGSLTNDGEHIGMLSATENVGTEGVLITYIFDIKSDAVAGTYAIELITSGTAQTDNGELALELLDENLEEVENSCENGSVTIPGYVISYDAAGGEGEPENQIKSKNVPVTLSTTQPTKDGFRFDGWKADSVTYMPGDVYEENADLSLVAVWTEVGGNIDVTASSVTAKPGEAVSVAVSVNNHEGFAGLEFDIVYDNTKLEYVSYEQKMTGPMLQINAKEGYDNRIYATAVSGTNITNVGEVFVLNFKVLDEAEAGESEIAIIPSDAFKYGVSGNEVDLAPIVTNGSVNVKLGVDGDINGDGTFNYYDVSRLYAIYRGKATADEKVNTDINGDGTFNYYDVSRLYAIYRGKAGF